MRLFDRRKRKKNPLMIMARDVIDIIKTDYDNDQTFAIIEFIYDGMTYQMGSWTFPADAKECRENIVFIFQDKMYKSFDEFKQNICINGMNILDLETPIEIIRAGIIGDDALLATPWGDTRLAKKAVNIV